MLVLLKYDVQLKIFSVGDGPKSKKLLTPNNISIFAFSARVAVSSSLRMKNRHIAWALIFKIFDLGPSPTEKINLSIIILMRCKGTYPLHLLCII